MRPQHLHHRIPTIITRARAIRRGMVRNPRLVALRALEEAIMPRTIVAVPTAQHAPVALAPRARAQRARLAIPRQQTQAVARAPAVRRRVRDVRFPAKVERRGPFVDGMRDLLPGLRRLRDQRHRARGGDVVVVELLDADGLVRGAVEARVHEEVAEGGGAEDGGVDGPLVGADAADVGVVVPGGRAACSHVSLVHVSISMDGGTAATHL